MANPGFSNLRVSKSNCLYNAAPRITAIIVKIKCGAFIFFITLTTNNYVD